MDAHKTLPRGTVGRRGLLGVVIQSALSNHKDLQELALVVIGLWAEDLTLHAELVYAGAVPPLVLALRDAPTDGALGTAPKAHLLSVRSLANIAVHTTYRKKLVESDTVPPLLALLGSTHPGVRLSASRVLCSLSGDIDGALAILRADGLAVLKTTARGLSKPGGVAAYTPVRAMKMDQSAIRLPATVVRRQVSKPDEANTDMAWVDDEASEQQLNVAVTRIQARYRGRLSRRTTVENLQVATWFTMCAHSTPFPAVVMAAPYAGLRRQTPSEPRSHGRGATPLDDSP
jgi:hypothetical protein